EITFCAHMSTPAGPGLAGAGHAHASGNYIVTDIFPGSGPWIIITHEVDVLTGQGRGVTVVNDVPMPIAPAVKGHFSTADILGFSPPGVTFQLVDSWVGALAPEDYESRVVRHTRAIFRALEPLGVPRIHFGTNTPARRSQAGRPGQSRPGCAAGASRPGSRAAARRAAPRERPPRPHLQPGTWRPARHDRRESPDPHRHRSFLGAGQCRVSL